ncbi:type III PLP-dependent enzyme domain-containing protein [Hoyosella subflava]|uniref:Decarboxylase n=1 Tax=Hoyosella subflava (strain DSM 45089 / JCM 17490 / NBRC 109087 / DQS3-9A1) TaxID=443218 RepID=F6EQU9_HOYSD|nr:alanine racemase [Hoyosella subflava]AEF39560.1 Decarboxylase [Hoyosella subflava DQS3-9A1]
MAAVADTCTEPLVTIHPAAPPVYLDPALAPSMQRTLADRAFLHSLTRSLGSPLNLLLPEQFAANVDAFTSVFRAHRIRGTVYYAHKANRSSALVRHLAATQARIDIASLGELQHALASGFTPDRIMATGPKTPEFLWLAARSGVVVNVDSPAELETLARICAAHRLPRLPVMTRFSGFSASGTTIASRLSRFGIHESDVRKYLEALDRNAAHLELVGVAYHLDTIGVAEKALALEGSLRLIHEFHAAGHRPRAIDIGGGYGVSYVARAYQWEQFTTELTRAVLGQRPSFTWRGHGYGLRAENGRLRGALSLYPAHRPVSGPAYLDELLRQRSPTWGQPYATLLQELMLDLIVEPGRALLDQCGTVLARVLEVREADSATTFVRLDINHSDVSLEEHGVAMDPIVIPEQESSREPGSGYLIGNLCLEADFISRRKIYFRSMPRAGDLLAFPNTAGYFMDFNADHALHQPIARKVALTGDGGWCLDDEYWPHTGHLAAATQKTEGEYS